MEKATGVTPASPALKQIPKSRHFATSYLLAVAVCNLSVFRFVMRDKMLSPASVFVVKHAAMKSSFVAVGALLCSSGLALAEIAWPQFRGVNSQGHADGEKPPIHFGPESNLVWKAKIPAGLSSPCICKDHIFLTGIESN